MVWVWCDGADIDDVKPSKPAQLPDGRVCSLVGHRDGQVLHVLTTEQLHGEQVKERARERPPALTLLDCSTQLNTRRRRNGPLTTGDEDVKGRNKAGGKMIVL
jgi:hypothetical protein